MARRVKTNHEVIEAWASGQASAGRILYSDGENLWSDELLIGTRRSGRRIVLWHDDVPQHTSNHLDVAQQYAQEVIR